MVEYSTIDPWIISRDTASEISFLTTVFGARERDGRMQDAKGVIEHAEVEMGDSVLMMFDSAAGTTATPTHLRIYVDDVDAVLERASKAGSRIVTEPTTMPWNDRVARFRDPQGHLWWVFQKLGEVEADEVQRRFGDPEYQRSLEYVKSSLVDEWADAAIDPEGSR